MALKNSGDKAAGGGLTMKFIMVIGDGMADYPVQELGGKTPLQVANHPHMDEIVSKGVGGTLRTIPKGTPSADIDTRVAVLSILGYDPKTYCVGRGPLEAASMGVSLGEEDLAFRCNLVTESDGILHDYSAGHVETEEARELMSWVDRHLGVPGEIRFYGGVSYRHLLVLSGSQFSEKVRCTPPHNVVGTPIREIMVTSPDEEGAETTSLLNEMIVESKGLLSDHPINAKRRKEGKSPANMIWPWGPGRKPRLPTLREKYGISGAVISAVDIINGMGIYAGMDVVKVPGATGYIDTNYEGKAEHALKSLEDHDFVLVHVEAPDEAGHIGDPLLKIRTIEDLDRRLLGRILEGVRGDFTIAVLADHMTPVTVRTHTADPVPFAMYSTTREMEGEIDRFDEASAVEGSLKIERGCEFMPLFLSYGGC